MCSKSINEWKSFGDNDFFFDDDDDDVKVEQTLQTIDIDNWMKRFAPSNHSK